MKPAFSNSLKTDSFFDIWTRRRPEIASLLMLLDHFQGGSLKHYPCQFNDVLRLPAAAFWAQSVRSDAIFDKRVPKVLYCPHFRPFRAGRAQPPDRPRRPPLGPPTPQISKKDPKMVPGISGSAERLSTLPQAFFFSQKNGPHIFGSPERLTMLPQALFFPEKWPPYFWKP